MVTATVAKPEDRPVLAQRIHALVEYVNVGQKMLVPHKALIPAPPIPSMGLIFADVVVAPNAVVNLTRALMVKYVISINCRMTAKYTLLFILKFN